MKKRIRLTALATLFAALLAVSCAVNPPSDGGESAKTLLDVSYGDDPLQTLDAYVPKGGGGGRGVVIMIHGGSWIAGDKDDFLTFPSAIRDEGFVVVNMNYRLANGEDPAANAIHIGDMIADVESVKEYVATKAKKWDCDPAKLVLLGFSAGGHLALLDTVTTRADGAVKGCVSLSGPTDFTDATFQTTEAEEGKTVLEGLMLVTGATGAAGDPATVALFKAASPALLCEDLAASGALTGREFVLVNGSADALVPPAQAAKMEAALLQAGATALRYESAGEGHALSIPTYQYALETYAIPLFDRVL